MWDRAKFEVELASVNVANQILLATFHAVSRRDPYVAVVAHDADSDKAVALLCDQFAYTAFKNLFAGAEEIARKFKHAVVIMPSDLVANPMSLEVDVGRVETSAACAQLIMSIDRARTVTLKVNFWDNDVNNFVCLRISGLDYKRLKHFLRECDGMLEELYASRRIDQRFLTQ